MLGNFSLTLVDSLDSLAVSRNVDILVIWDLIIRFEQKSYIALFLQVLGNASEFKRAVQIVIDNVTFDLNSTVQVFETNIR